VLIYTSSPVKVVVAQDLAPHAPAAASGMILGMTSAVAGVLYIALRRLQEAVGFEVGIAVGIAVGFLMVVPAALTTLLVLRRHPDVAR
jgi:MFS transporter, FSR family, fosmidomycin resistance protein